MLIVNGFVNFHREKLQGFFMLGLGLGFLCGYGNGKQSVLCSRETQPILFGLKRKVKYS
jgi:hypothetical protein